jgi:hypothetical protein
LDDTLQALVSQGETALKVLKIGWKKRERESSLFLPEEKNGGYFLSSGARE